ncbi:NtaA/DmoA family FMN-dependent monooxygenase [Pseudomonas palleroniana]
MTERHMLLSAYVLVPGSHFGAMWRHPYSEVDYCRRELFESLALSLERGGFDYAFIPESLALPMGADGHYETMVKAGGVGTVRHDPVALVSAMLSVTRRLKFTVTLSTTFNEPYHLARTLSTLDHFSNGRMAWNVVTSAGPSNHLNFAHLPPLSHEDLFTRADEVLEVCRGLWGGWEKNAVVADKASGVYADTGRIHPIAHNGRFFDVQGPLTLPRGPGAEPGPVLMMAGTSARFCDFAARWGEVVFAIQSDGAGMRKLRADIRASAARYGRDPEAIRLMAAVQPVIGETMDIAKARAAYLDSLITDDAAMSFFAVMFGGDLSSVKKQMTLQSFLDMRGYSRTVDAGGLMPWLAQLMDEDPNMPVIEAARRFSGSTGTPRLVGTGADIADQLEALFADSCDGFVITPTHFPGTFDEFAHAVMPELRARGLIAVG